MVFRLDTEVIFFCYSEKLEKRQESANCALFHKKVLCVSSSSGQNRNANVFCDFSRNLFYTSYDELIVLDVTSFTALVVVVFSTYIIRTLKSRICGT